MQVLSVKNKQKLENLIKEHAYEEGSIARRGYSFKELEINGEKKTYLIVEGDEKIKEMLDECAEILKDEEKVQVLKKIKEEEESAVKGFGDIFG